MGTLRFRLFGFPVQVLPGFWLLLILLGMWMADSEPQIAITIGVVAFVSIIVHELGHAVVASRFGLQPQIALHMMGGATLFSSTAKLSRGRDIAVSFAGPLAGFGLAAVSYFLLKLYAPPPGQEELSPFIRLLVITLNINVVWSALNLVPVVPFDGGRILMAAMGPDRRNLAAGLSLAFGLLAALVAFRVGQIFPAVLFASSAIGSFSRLKQEQQTPPQPAVSEHSIEAALKAAEQALKSEAYEQASKLAQGVLTTTTHPRLQKEALEVLLWARLGLGDAQGARSIVVGADMSRTDPYVVAAVNEQSGHLDEAQRALVEARVGGDQRVEVTALLVKVLLKQGKFEQATKLTQEILTRINPEDVRRVAEQAQGGGAQGAAAELSLALAKAEKNFTDAKNAVLGFVAAGSMERAAEALKLARSVDPTKVAKLLEDQRLATVRSRLEADQPS